MSSQRRILAVALVVPLLILFLWMVRGLLGALAFAGLFAVLLWPLKAKLPPKWSPVLIVLGSIVAIFMPLSFVGVMAVRSFAGIARSLAAMPREQIAAYTATIYAQVDSVARRFRFNVSHDDVTQALTDAGQWVLTALGGFFGMLAAATPGTLILVFVFLIAFYFMLRDGEALRGWIAAMLPFDAEDTGELFSSIQDAVRGVMLGSLLVGLVQSAIALLLLVVLDIPGAFVLGVLCFFMSFVPIAGTMPITGGAVIYLLINGRLGAAAIMGVGIVIVGLSDNIVRPMVHARSGNMHPLLSLVAIFGGLQAFGALGVFMGPVIAAFALWGVELYGRSTASRLSRASSSYVARGPDEAVPPAPTPSQP